MAPSVIFINTNTTVIPVFMHAFDVLRMVRVLHPIQDRNLGNSI